MKKLKIAVIGIYAASACALIGGVAQANGGISLTKILAKNVSTETWGHYNSVEPGYKTLGCREFWIGCDSHNIVYSAPSTGTIVDRGAPTAQNLQEWEGLDDRVIPQIKLSATEALYGEYPQTVVSADETALLGALDEIEETDSNGYITYQGKRYAKLKCKRYVSSSNADTTFSDGSNPVKDKYYYFKVEPIKWVILDAASPEYNDSYLLRTEMVLDKSKFQENVDPDNSTTFTEKSRTARKNYDGIDTSEDTYLTYDQDYKFSVLRKTLNESFYSKAFSTSNRILAKTVDNSASSGAYYVYDTHGNCNTTDKVFALSYSEYTNPDYFSSTTGESESRKTLSSDYAIAIGAYTGNTGKAYYWTRTPSKTQNYAYRVASNGKVSSGYFVGAGHIGYMAAIRISNSDFNED